MTRETAEARAAAEAEALLDAATVAPRPGGATIRGPELSWGSMPRDVKALLGAVALVVFVGLGFLVFGPRPKPIAPVLGYVDAGPPPAPRPTTRPAPPFKLPWWK